MDLGTQTLLSVALLLALNNALVRISWVRPRATLFYAIQVLNGVVAARLLWRGLPGFQEVPAVGWMLGMLLILHIVQNVRWRRSILAEEGHSKKTEVRASAIRAALGEDDTDA